jgi:hypothetical protein
MKKTIRIIKIKDYLYILSDDDINVGDWCIFKVSENRELSICELVSKGFNDTISAQFDVGNPVSVYKWGLTKIIATNDPTITETIKGEGNNCDGFKFLPKIPQSLIEYYAKHQPEYVELEYERQWLRNPEFYGTGQENKRLNDKLKLQNNEVVWVKPIEEHLYTREQVEEIVLKAIMFGYKELSEDSIQEDQWIKENLK